MLDYDQRKKLSGEWDWGDNNAQQRADFNKKMRQKLKLWLKEMPAMIAILKGLPPRVKKNAKLEDDLPNLIEFVDIFLETIRPLPVGTHKTGEKRVFENIAVDARTHPSHWEKDFIFYSPTGKEYIIRTEASTAFPAEVIRHGLLEKHVKRMQRYIDPNAAVAISYDQLLELNASRDIHAELREKARVLGPCEASCQWLHSNELIQTEPPGSPKIIELEEEPK